jgi:hypothetical protein
MHHSPYPQRDVLRAEITPILCAGPGGQMSTVIRFPRVCGRTETPPRAAGASAVVIILPVIRIERVPEAPSGVKAKPAKSVAKAPSKRRKRTPAAALPAAARRRG